MRISPFDNQGRRQTSFAGVEVLPVVAETDHVDVPENDIRVDVYRSSGPGGQSVNTTDSAVRLTHLPTGIVVTCQNEKSQLQNKAAAMRVLQAKLLEKARKDRQAELDALKGDDSGSWGNQMRSYVLHPYQMVKDLRTNYEVGNTCSVFDGEIDSFLEAGIRWRKQGEQLTEPTRPAPVRLAQRARTVECRWPGSTAAPFPSPRLATPRVITFEHVSKVYGEGHRPALAEVTLQIDKGDFVFLVGPSGSGKSTFLRLVLKEEKASSGAVQVAGRDVGRLRSWKVPALRRQIGVVFQDFRLLADKTRLRERGLRPAGAGQAAPRHRPDRARDPRPGRAAGQGEAPAARAVRG